LNGATVTVSDVSTMDHAPVSTATGTSLTLHPFAVAVVTLN